MFQDGSASLHTRSLKYGKLRNGYFLQVDPKGIGRSKTHVLALQGANGGEEIDVVLGVNGFVWISKKVALETSKSESAGRVSITRLEEEASEAIYSSQNDYIAPATRKEIARVGNCIKAMVRHNQHVDEDTLTAVYEAAVALGESAEIARPDILEGKEGQRVVDKGLAMRIGMGR